MHDMLESQAQEHVSKAAESTAEQVLHEWVQQPQHLMARPLRQDLAPTHKLAQPHAAAQKSSLVGLICRIVGALLDSAGARRRL